MALRAPPAAVQPPNDKEVAKFNKHSSVLLQLPPPRSMWRRSLGDLSSPKAPQWSDSEDLRGRQMSVDIACAMPPAFLDPSSAITSGGDVGSNGIPGHHFPPIIVAATAIYLTVVFAQSTAFGPTTLAEVFPRLVPKDDGRKDEEPQPQPQPQPPSSPDGGGGEEADEPVLYDDEKKLLKIFVVGVPDWQEPGYSYLSILTNVLLALLTLDLVFRGPFLHPETDLRFSRVGFVDQTSAKVLFREPDAAQLPVYVHLKEDGGASSSWTTTDRIYYLDADTDYTYPITFTGLRPDTSYTYSLSNDLSGKFTTAPGHFSPKANSLTFVTSSCIKANFPYQPFSHSLAFHGFDYLSRALRSLPNPAAFMLFLGDFIYVDVPLRLSSSYLHYRAEYRRAYASPSWNLPGLSSLPWLHTLDDHEIANDWSGGNDTAPFPAASDPFIHYHVSVNPPIPPSSSNSDEPNTTYFQVSRGPASFFLLDTRRYRTNPEPEPSSLLTTSNHSMLGDTQLSSLLTYLGTPEPTGVYFKIISSSVPFTKNWRFGTSDTWGGFLSERSQILRAMHAAERDLGVRVIILSGDRHEFGAIRYPPPLVSLNANGSDVVYDRTPSSGPHEFSVGPLSMFYLPIRTFRQIDDEDVVLKYRPDGNSKFGVVELRNLEGKGGDQKSILKYTLWVDGKVEWDMPTPTAASPGATTLATSPPAARDVKAPVVRPPSLVMKPASASPVGTPPPTSATTLLSLTSKEWIVPPRPKPGRKPATDTPPSRRKAQNRAAQRAFRERRAARVSELEEHLKEVEDENDKEQEELRAHIARLENDLEQCRAEMLGWPDDAGDDTQIGCGNCTLESRCQCIDEAFNAMGGNNSNIAPLEKRSRSPALGHEPDKRIKIEPQDSLEVDFTSMYSKPPPPPRSLSDQVSPTSAIADPCGFCSDSTPCICAEMQAEREADQQAATNSLSRGHPSSISQFTPPPSEGDVSLPLPAAAPSATGSTCAGGPGTCAQCRSDPNSTLFCKSLAASRLQAAGIGPSSGGCCGGSRTTGGGCCQSTSAPTAPVPLPPRTTRSRTTTSSNSSNSSNTTLPPPRSKAGVTLTCADAYTTLSRHPAYERASGEIASWMPKLHASDASSPSSRSGSTQFMARPAMEIDAANVMAVLKDFDRRFGRNC
ncbi:hypothetical protein DV738_g1486, partial [Chaetothyriales sp. CBS 135597]